MKHSIIVWSTLMGLLASCGGGSASNGLPVEYESKSEPSQTYQGYLIDSAVAGVTYHCGIKQGVTDAQGAFICDALPVRFSINNIELGSLEQLPSDNRVFPQDLVGVDRADVNNSDVLKIATVLQSLDRDGNASNGIEIVQTQSQSVALTINVQTSTIEEIQSTLLAQDKTIVFKSIEEVQAHLSLSLSSTQSSIESSTSDTTTSTQEDNQSSGDTTTNQEEDTTVTNTNTATQEDNQSSDDTSSNTQEANSTTDTSNTTDTTQETNSTTQTSNTVEQESSVSSNDYDGDSLFNSQEDRNGNGVVDEGETDPNNRDTDGDGLWDANEIVAYNTDPLNPDSDGDGVIDGWEVYSCDEEMFDSTKLSSHKAQNSNHNDVPDLIDALDPYNDSDEDGRSNLYENEQGTDGCQANVEVAYITQLCAPMQEIGAVYIPGGFDVDGDGLKESGFWFTPYPASTTIQAISSSNYTNFSETMEAHFNILNGDNLNYTTQRVYHPNELYQAQFIVSDSNSSSYFTGLYGMDLPLVIEQSNLPSCVVDGAHYSLKLPTNKQYIHILKLLEANGEDNVTIKNGLLANDPNVPSDYETKIYHIGEFREYTGDIVLLESFEAPEYWSILSENQLTTYSSDGSMRAWIDIGLGELFYPGYFDPHAIVVRKGWSVDLTYGLGSGDATVGNEILFRVATPYMK